MIGNYRQKRGSELEPPSFCVYLKDSMQLNSLGEDIALENPLKSFDDLSDNMFHLDETREALSSIADLLDSASESAAELAKSSARIASSASESATDGMGGILGDALGFKFSSSADALSSSQETAEEATSSIGLAFQGLEATIEGSASAFRIFSAAASVVGIGYKVWQIYRQHVEEAVQASARAGEELLASTNSIAEHMEKIRELRAQLADSDTSEEEAVTIKNQLLDIQENLSDEYGNEANNLNLVNGNLNDQMGLLQDISKEKANEYLNDSNNRIGSKEAQKQMMKENHYVLGHAYNKEEIIAVAEEFEEQGIKIRNGYYDTEISLNADAKNAEQTISDFMNRLREVQAGSSEEVSASIQTFLDQASKSYTEASDIVDNYEQSMLSNLYAEMLTQGADSGSPADIYEQYATAIDEYNTALMNGEGIEEARQKYESLKESADSTKETYKDFIPLFDQLDSKLNENAIKSNEFDEKLSSNSKLKSYAEELKRLKLDSGNLRDFDSEDGVDERGETVFQKLKEQAKEYDVSLDSLIDKLIEFGYVQDEAINIDDLDNTSLDNSDILANVQSLSEGFAQLDNIYADIHDQGDFNWSSILGNEEFKNIFGKFENEYDNFIQTISDSPSDISACQSAFNNLATAYLNGSGVLREVTDETKNATIAMLEQMGISNASEIVEQSLTANKILSKLETLNLADATTAEIQELLNEQNALYGTNFKLSELLAYKYNLSNTKIDTANDIEQLIAFANAAGVSAAKLTKLQNLKNVMSNNGATDSRGQITASEKFAEKTYFALQDGSFWDADDSWTNLNASDYIKPVSYGGGSASNSSGGFGGSAGNSASNYTPEKTLIPETFDFIETAINRVESAFDRLKTKAEETFRSFTSRSNSYTESLKKVKKEIHTQEKAYSSYMERANRAGLDEGWVKKIQNGSINISDITDETLKEQIKDYQKWYEKAIECKDKIEELKVSQKELTQAKIELLVTKYDKLISKVESANNRIENKIDLKESWGSSASVANYTSMNKNNQKQISYITNQNTELKKLQKTVTRGSEAWYEYNERINSNNASLQDLKKSMVENAKAAAELARETADKKADKYDAKDELYDAKIANANSAATKNKLIQNKITNIDKRQEAYNEAYDTSSKQLNSSASSISKLKAKSTKTKNAATNKANQTYNSVLKKVKEKVKAGKKIPTSLLNKAAQLNDNGNLYNACVQYNAYYDEKASNKEIANLYKETSATEKREYAIEEVQNIADAYDQNISTLDTISSNQNSVISKMEAAGITTSKQQYLNQISNSKQKQTQLEAKRRDMQLKLDEMVQNGYLKKSDAQYKEMQDTINSLDASIAECITDQITWNKALNQLDLSNLKALANIIDSLRDKLSGLVSLSESHGHAASDDLLLEQIEAEQKAIEQSDQIIKQNLTNLKKYATTSIDEGGWGLNLTNAQADTLLQLAKAQDVDGIKEFCAQLGIEYGQYTELQELLENIADTQSNKISSQISQEELYDSLLQKRIDTLSDIINALDEINEKRDRALALEKARLNLEKAKNNLTQKVWNGTEWVYAADSSAIKEAQETLDNAEFEEIKNVIQDAIDAIEKLIDSNNLYNDDGSISQDLHEVLKTVQLLDKDLGDSLIASLSEKYPDLDWNTLLSNTNIQISNAEILPAFDMEQIERFCKMIEDSLLPVNYNLENQYSGNLDYTSAHDTQTVYQEFSITMPNIHDSSVAEQIAKELHALSTAKIQYFNKK